MTIVEKTRKPRRAATEETKIKMSLSHVGKKGLALSEEQRRKMTAGAKLAAAKRLNRTFVNGVLIAKATVVGSSAHVITPSEWFDNLIRCVPTDYSPNYDMLDMIIEGPIIRRVTRIGGSCHVMLPQQWKGCMIKCSLVDTGGLG